MFPKKVQSSLRFLAISDFWLLQSAAACAGSQGTSRGVGEPAGLLLALQGQNDPAGVDAAARKRVELLAMNAVFKPEKALGRMARDVSAQRGLDYDIESIDADGNLFFIEVKGRVDGADSVIPWEQVRGQLGLG